MITANELYEAARQQGKTDITLEQVEAAMARVKELTPEELQAQMKKDGQEISLEAAAEGLSKVQGSLGMRQLSESDLEDVQGGSSLSRMNAVTAAMKLIDFLMPYITEKVGGIFGSDSKE